MALKRNCLCQFHGIRPRIGCTARIYIDNVMLTLHNVTLTSQKSYKHNNSVITSKQTVRNEVYVVVVVVVFSIKYCHSDILLKKNPVNFIYAVDKTFRVIKIIIMDFNRSEPICYRTNFPYANSG